MPQGLAPPEDARARGARPRAIKGRRSRFLLAAALIASACGDDPPPPPKKPGAAGAGPAAKGGPPVKKGQLQPRVHVEERVKCASPEKPTGDACTPDAPACDVDLFCLPVGTGHSCEPCPERASIRHEFKDRDFVADQMRDPFQSFIIVQPGLEEPVDKKPEAGPCTRADQFVATNYSYLDLSLVGIVAQGTQRKVLMMDRGNLGHIIKRGDCVGKEKAVVKDIGKGYITFVIAPDINSQDPNKAPTERSIQLHPKGLNVPVPQAGPGAAPTAPVVVPPTEPARP
jgi:Tfp pilus assembly protein PilP